MDHVVIFCFQQDCITFVVISKIRPAVFSCVKEYSLSLTDGKAFESERDFEGRSLNRYASWNDAMGVDVKVSGGVVNGTHDLLCSRSLARAL